MQASGHNLPMCILFLAIKQHPNYPLIIAANRDEYHNRPSLPMHYWEDQPEILAGRDKRAGGTWLGVNRNGRFSAVTNFRTGQSISESARSRGELVTRFLSDNDSIENFLDLLRTTNSQYSPFNLVFGHRDDIRVFCNQDQTITSLSAGFHSISNGYIDHHWPKMHAGINQLESFVKNNNRMDIDQLNLIMHDQTQAKESDLPETGVSKAVERFISSIFIIGESYGTRTTSYVFYTASALQVYELNYDPSGDETGKQTFTVTVNP